MATKTFREARRALLQKGFKKDPKQTHHEYYYLYINDRITGIYTYLSHKSDGDDLGRNVISGMKSQMKLQSNQQVLDFIACSISYQRYLEILEEDGNLPQVPEDDD
jgi:hypothetical protein